MKSGTLVMIAIGIIMEGVWLHDRTSLKFWSQPQMHAYITEGW